MTQNADDVEYLLLWVDPRDDVATAAVKDHGGAWLLRVFVRGTVHDGPYLCQPENTDPATLAGWVTSQIGRPAALTRTRRRSSRWLPYWLRRQLHPCGDGTIYRVTFRAVDPQVGQ